MSILDDLKAARTHDIDCTCDACKRAMNLIGEVRGALRSDSPPPKLREDELRRQGKPSRWKTRGS